VIYQVEPWEIWPRKETPGYQRGSPFRSGYQDTLNRLDKELRHLGAREVVIQVRTKRENIRLDGQIRSDATMTHPGVIIAFKRHGKHPMSMACDACRGWQDNLRAICFTLERLRLADIYGVTSSGEQYRGWEALPPPGAQPIRAMTKEQAADLIAKLSGIPQDLILGDKDVRVAAVRVARVKVHPDKGGSAADAAEVSVAADLLEKAKP